MAYWLMKSEPSTYSIADLERDGRTAWEGVRNYQARNFLRDSMSVGDPVLFYHSNAEPSGVAGLGRIARAAYPDATAFDPNSKYYDAASTPDNPRWFLVDVGFVERFPRTVALSELKEDSQLTGMEVTRKGSRLSVQPVSEAHFQRVLDLAQRR
jgi:predicted RNA-binding protein with PUA-like domain